MTAPISRYTKAEIEARGWQSGSTLENRLIYRMSRWGVLPTDLSQQHKVGRYRLDFADPDVMIGIEADGFYHRMPGKAGKDQERDAWLLTKGWFIFRIPDDCSGSEFEQHLFSVLMLLRDERESAHLPEHHEPRSKRSKWMPKPSRLAYATGYREPV
jgi:very-short-patch-repair endonuclease